MLVTVLIYVITFDKLDTKGTGGALVCNILQCRIQTLLYHLNGVSAQKNTPKNFFQFFFVACCQKNVIKILYEYFKNNAMWVKTEY